MDNKFQELLTQIRDDQLERFLLDGSTLGEERIGQLVKELKGNKSVKDVWLWWCGLGPRFAGVLCDVLKLNTSVTTLSLWGNNLGEEGARAIAEVLKVNQCVKDLHLGRNNFGLEGSRALAEALKENGILIKCCVDYNQYLHKCEIDGFCKRNVDMHKKAQTSVVFLLALRRMRRVLWIPREIMVMIGKMLWKTKSDVEAWNK